MWRIKSVKRQGKKLYWSEEYGWTWPDFANVFTDEAKESYLLPKGGEWEEL